MIIQFDGCNGCLKDAKKLAGGSDIDWNLYQFHLYLKHDHVELWKKMYGNSFAGRWSKDAIQKICSGRLQMLRNRLQELGVSL